MLNRIKDWWILIIFVFVTIFGFVFISFENEKGLIENIYSSLDTASAVALAFLAFLGYAKYTKEEIAKKSYLKSLQELSKSEVENKEVSLVIQFGGQSDMIEPIKEFLNKKGFEGKIIVADKFGDKDNNVEKEDILKLKDYCKRIRSELSIASKVHIYYGGACIGYAVIADILSNSTDLLFYHKNASTYELWYTDVKSDKKHSVLMEPKL